MISEAVGGPIFSYPFKGVIKRRGLRGVFVSHADGVALVPYARFGFPKVSGFFSALFHQSIKPGTDVRGRYLSCNNTFLGIDNFLRIPGQLRHNGMR